MLNNWILLFSAFFVLFATMFPTLSEAIWGAKGRITVGATFFNQWMIPIGLGALVLTGIGPLLAWRKSALINLRDSFLFPVLCGLVAGGIVLALGVRIWSSGLSIAFGGFVVGTVVQEFWRGARVRQQTSGTDLFTALIGLVGRNKRRYGGYLVHVGVVLIFLGFAGENFKKQETALLKPGKQVTVAEYTMRLDALKVTDDASKQAVTAHVTALRDGKEIAKLYPARWFFRGREDEATTEVAIRRSIGTSTS
jgi:cytochrome c-type biogenesis protein CcmF